MQPWARYSACLSLSVHTCEMGVIRAYLISCSGIKAILHKHLACTQVTATATRTMTSSFGAVAQTILFRSSQRLPLVCPHPLSDVPLLRTPHSEQKGAGSAKSGSENTRRHGRRPFLWSAGLARCQPVPAQPAGRPLTSQDLQGEAVRPSSFLQIS